MAELNMTWEDKLKRAEEMQQQRYVYVHTHKHTHTRTHTHTHRVIRIYHQIHCYREIQLAEMGIALHEERGALGVFSPKKVHQPTHY